MKFLYLTLFLLSSVSIAQQKIEKLNILDELNLSGSMNAGNAVLNIDNSPTNFDNSNITVSNGNFEISGNITSTTGPLTLQNGRLEVNSTVEGSRPCPAMTEAQRDAISSPSDGDCVYNTDTQAINTYSTDDTDWREAGGSTAVSSIFSPTPVTARELIFPYNQVVVDTVNPDKVLVDNGNRNVLKNANFSTGVGSEWAFTSASGAIVSTSLDGTGLEVTNSGSGGNVCQSYTTPTNQWQNLNFTVSAYVKTSATDVSVCSIVDSVEQNCIPVSSVNKFNNYVLAGVGGSTSVGICIKATSGSSVYYVDEAYVGASDSIISGISQPGFFGQLRYAGTTNCEWNAAATSSTQVLSADSDCPTPTVTGYVKAPSTKIPAVVIPAGSPTGKYTFNFIGGFYNSNASASSSSISWFLYNGTEYYSMGQNGAATSAAVSAYTPNLSATVEYTTSTTDVTFQLAGNYPSGGGRNFGVYARTAICDLYIDVFYSPNVTSSIFNDRCKNLFNCEYEFSAYISSAGTVSGENLDWINGSVAVSDTSQYAITLNTSLGLANGLNCVVSANGNNDTDLLAKLKSSTSTTVTYRTLTGATKVASDVYIKCSKVGADYDSAKVNKIIGTFADVATMPGTPNGQPKLLTFIIAGASATTSCSASPCTVYQAVGGTVSATRASTGNYTATIPTGTIWHCNATGWSNGSFCLASQLTSTTVNIICGGGTDNSPVVNCMGY